MNEQQPYNENLSNIIKEIYDYSFSNLEGLKNSKRHLEIKSLYVLQATALLLTLFLALDNSATSVVLICLKMVFYLVIAFTVLLLLLGLNDSILSIFGLNKDGLQRQTLDPETILISAKSNNDSLNQYQTNFIIDNTHCHKNLSKLIDVKAKLFNLSLFGFTSSMFIVILMAFLNLER
ncbi:hypothetical protein [Anaerorhabdus sp.]|uniref:hypothetical protein n=1 Tax=Anaerorhabdus sp. TaxID=1872524 RepID=UPI002FCC6470